jgi:hypothetical protein
MRRAAAGVTGSGVAPDFFPTTCGTELAASTDFGAGAGVERGTAVSQATNEQATTNPIAQRDSEPCISMLLRAPKMSAR